MALPFPNVPNLPGVPPIPRLPGVVVSAGLTVASGVISTLIGNSAKRPVLWGVFDSNNQLALSPDSVLSFSYRQRKDISNFPVVPDSFANYNKVDTPFEIQVRVSKGGTLSDRTNLIKQAQALLDSLQLYTIRTPEISFQNCNLEDYDIDRPDPTDSNFLKNVVLNFVQILQANAQYTNTSVNTANAQSSAALPTSGVGKVQPQVPSGVLASSGQSALQSAASFSSLF